MGFLQVVKKAKEIWSWYSFAAGVSALAITGVGIAAGGAVWLVKAGLPVPLALMAGYCTLVGAVYLAMAPLAYRALVSVRAKVPSVSTKKIAPPINLTPIRLQHQYALGPASRMWVGLLPEGNSTHESNSWYETFASAIQQGKLKFVSRWPGERDMMEYERNNPSEDTLVTRVEFKRYAASIGEDPLFLRDA